MPAMTSLRTLALATLLVALPAITSAQTPHPLSPADTAAIDTTLAAFGDTLTVTDFDTFATLFTDDADFVNIVGMHWHGRAQIVKAHRIVFTTRYHGNPQHFIEKTEAALAPNLALVVGTIKMDDYTAQDGKRMTNNLFRMTLVMEKHDGKWLIRSAQNTIIDTEAAKHDPGY